MKTDAVRARVRPDVTVAPEVAEILDELREEQVALVERIRAASTRMSGASSRVSFSMAGHARLTQQFFDAQRAILMRLATFDAQVGDEHVRAGDPFVERASADLIEAQRELANLLDDWWATTNRHGEQMLARAAARALRATASLPPPIVVPTPFAAAPTPFAAAPTPFAAAPTPFAAAPTPFAAAPSLTRALPPPDLLPIAPAGTAAPTVLPPPNPTRAGSAVAWPAPAAASPLRADLVLALDQADVTNLDEVLASLADALRSSVHEHPKEGFASDARGDDLIIGLRPRNADELLAGLEMLERHLAAPLPEESAARRLVTRTVLPMVAATTALTAVMAWIG